MEGGRFLGAGTYGCAFSPPLLCKGKKRSIPGKVGKITLENLAKQEIVVANQIRKVPLATNYFVLPEPESCELAPQEEQRDPGLQECREDVEKREGVLEFDEMRQLIEPFGGTKPFYALFNTMNLHPKRFDFFRFMRHILEAGSTLLIAGVCHFDLHFGNLLVDKNQTVRIIDFGFSFLSKSINEVTLDGRWKRLRFGFESDASHPSIHNSEPPEITIMNALRANMYSVNLYSVNQAVSLTVLGKDIFKDMEKYLGLPKEQSRDELVRFWNTSGFAKKREYVKLWKTYWPGFDSWSIGCILLETLKALLLLPEFTKGEYATKKAAILSALQGLLDPNPRTRLDCMEALAVYDPGNPWIQRFGSAWLAERKQQRSKVKIEKGGSCE